MFALTLIIIAIGASWVLTRPQSQSVSATHQESTKALSEQTTVSNTRPTTSLPAEDVPGRDLPGLPRYPGSVRVDYERKEQDRLAFTTARYLSHAKLDVIRGFYRGIFRSKNWSVANAEFSEGEWTFLVVDGEREVEVRIESHSRGVRRVVIESSEPLPEKEPAPKKTPQKREARPATQEPASPPPSRSATPTPAPQSASPASQSASPAPQSASPAPQPAPVPYDYEEGGDDWDDDGGGDDWDDDGGGDD